MSEALAIKPQHIDGKRLIIRVVEGKGGKQREVPISPELLARLRKFWASHRNPDWLFPGTGRGWKGSGKTLRQALHQSDHSMTKASIWAAIKVAKAECGLSVNPPTPNQFSPNANLTVAPGVAAPSSSSARSNPVDS